MTLRVWMLHLFWQFFWKIQFLFVFNVQEKVRGVWLFREWKDMADTNTKFYHFICGTLNLLWSQKLYFSLVSHVKILFPKHLNFSTKCRLWPSNEMGFHFGKWSWIPGVVSWSYLKLNVLYQDWSVILFLRRPLSCTSDLRFLWIFRYFDCYWWPF